MKQTQMDSLLRRNIEPLIAFVRRRAGGIVAERESASDIAQSVFRQVIEEADQLDLRSESAFRNLLYLKATRKILDRNKFYHRKRRDAGREQMSKTVACQAPGRQETPSAFAVAREELSRIEVALETLPAAQREAVAMSRLMGLDYEQIAERLGRSVSAVRGLVARGLAAVATQID